MASYRREAGCLRLGAPHQRGGGQTGAGEGHYLHPELFGATEKKAIGATSAPAITLSATPSEMGRGNLR